MAVKEDLSRRFFEILGDFGEQLTKDIVQELLDKGVSGGGGTASELAGSITFKVTSKPSIIFSMNDYWEYVENGSRPSKYKGNKHSIEKIESLIKWIKWKGIKPTLYDRAKAKAVKGLKGAERKTARENAYEKSVKSLAYAIATKIAQKGTIKRFNYKGSNFIKDVLKDMRVVKLQNDIAREIGLEIEVILNDKLKGK